MSDLPVIAIVGGTGAELRANRLFEPPKWETRVETFETDEATKKVLGREEALVKTGDPVVQELNSDQPAGSPQEATPA